MASIYKDHNPSGATGDYLKLKDGDRVKLRFASQPAVVTYDGKKLRYQWVVYNRSAKLAQIYEAGPQVFGQLAELYDEWGEPTEFDVTISRTGSGQFDTSYSVSPSPKSVSLSEKEKEAVDMIKFPSGKSKLLSEYHEDGVLPEALKPNDEAPQPDPVHEPRGDEEISLQDIPF